LGRLLHLRRLVARSARQHKLRLGVPLRLGKLGAQCLGPVVLLLQRLSQLGGRALGGLLRLGGLVARLARQRKLRLGVPLRLGKLGAQCLGPVVFLLQCLSRLSSRALGGLLHLRRLVARLARQRKLRLGVPLRLGKLGAQCLGPVVLLLQRLSQLGGRALAAWLHLRRLVARRARQRKLRLGVPLRVGKLGAQCLGPVVFLLQRLSQLGGRALGGLLHLRRLLARRARQRKLRLEVPPRVGKLGAQCLGPVVFLLQRLSQLG